MLYAHNSKLKSNPKFVDDGSYEAEIEILMNAVERYLADGANPNIMRIVQPCSGKLPIQLTPLRICLGDDFGCIGIKLAELLLQAGASTELLAYNTVDGYTYSSPLMNAVRHYSGTSAITIAKLLLKHGANVNYINAYGDDVLIYIDRYQTPENQVVLHKMIADARKQ